jgi:low affinity Fe/Cu permease
MCFSPEVSLLTLILGLTGSLLTWNLGKNYDKIIGGYLAYVSLMQLSEYLLWSHQKCDSHHKNLSVSGMLLNIFQPVVLGGLVLTLNPSMVHKTLVVCIVAAYLAIGFVYYIPQYTSDLQCTTPRPDDPHLVWNWTILKNYELYWLLYIVTSMAIALLGMPTVRTGIFLAGGMLISMVISILLYPRQDMGAMWCYFAALAPIGYYIARTM